MLSKMYGIENVLSLNQIRHESPETDQIQVEQAIRPLVVRRRSQPSKVAQIQSPQVQQQKLEVSTYLIPQPIKRELVQNRLIKQLMRQSNIVMPTSDDIRIAKSRADTVLKCADLEYQHRLDQELQRQEREKRRSRYYKDIDE